jgi:hypothetical protein
LQDPPKFTQIGIFGSPENFSRQLVDEDVLEAGQELRKADPSDGLGHRGQLGA